MSAEDDLEHAAQLINSGFLNELQQAAIGLNEMFKNFVAGGFTEDQALSLVAKIVTNTNLED